MNRKKFKIWRVIWVLSRFQKGFHRAVIVNLHIQGKFHIYAAEPRVTVTLIKKEAGTKIANKLIYLTK